jgi:hypothetical protein
VAIANLGAVGQREKLTSPVNPTRVKNYVQKYLEMSQDMKNTLGQGGAYLKLGELLSKEGDYDSSS